jgi:hypothetical protein
MGNKFTVLLFDFYAVEISAHDRHSAGITYQKDFM